MLKNLKTVPVLLVLLSSSVGFARTRAERIENLKSQIFQIAESFSGQGDPDQSKQRVLEVYVNALTQENPMPPIAERIPILAGTWKQVWGPYDYRNSDGGIDPTIGLDEIYQVVSAQGYYYNVAPIYKNGDRSRERIGLLRGKYKLDDKDPNGLKVKFTKYPGVDPRPNDMEIWELAALAEAGQLENKVTIVPTLIVRLFFGGGKLEEIYTDHDMRILYGTSARRNSRRSIYVMKRVD